MSDTELREAAKHCLDVASDPRWTALASAWLAEHPEDDGEPVSREWMESTGLSYRYQRPAFFQIFNPNNRELILLRYGATRGDVRRLLAALGVKL